EACDFARVSFRKDTFAVPVTQVRMVALKKTSGALNVEVPAGAFLQPSKEGEAALVGAVMSALSSRKLGKKDKIADLFSGCGTFAGHILERYSVHAVEGERQMAETLAEAAKGNARFSAEWRDLFKEPVSTRELRDYSAVVFDPPRAGAKEQCQKLSKSSVPLIIGVSCNPATFARDAKILTAGGYKFKTAQMVDQFTWSTHSEIVGVFEKE
ncbi:MAG TPA: class I SAM-dependent RNA methyltransferase, partial [Alphaproteobacteria bacterium]|nr:class I SAM-dependent RNA methyltransferase [Alphaproteobacteria bacterium]